MIGNKHSNWKGGKTKSNGYIMLYKPEHLKQINNYVPEHRLVMEKHLGRYLTKNEIVHHVNGIRHDNRIENLLLTTQSEHMKKYHPNTGKKTRFIKGMNLGIKLSEEIKKKMRKPKSTEVKYNMCIARRKRSKFNKNQILFIRKKYVEENIAVSELSKIYNVSQVTIYQIVRVKTWKNIYPNVQV